MTTKTFPDTTRARLMVVGDIMLDRYWSGGTSRISPEAPVPVVKVEGCEERVGGAANVALNIAALGARVSLGGIVGEDEAARTLHKLLAGSDIHSQLLRRDDCTTITKLRVMSRHQQLIRLDFEDHIQASGATELADKTAASLDEIDVLVLSDYNKGSLNAVHDIIRVAREAGLPVLVDPKGNDFAKYRGATLLTPNLGEFETVMGRCADEDELVAKGESLRARLELEAILITRSERGMTLLVRDEAPLHLPARAREVFDVTGAGDTVIGVFATVLAAGESLANAATLANAAAGIVVGKLGAATVSARELEVALNEQSSVRRGVTNETDLLDFVAEVRARGETVVMTNGCFDLLHPGHITYLEEAAALGDHLIVAVNDDDSVKKLKGERRPVNRLADRMHMLAALSCVDWVVPFSEDTPEQLICHVAPNVLVKGGDYRPEQIAGHDCVVDNGGEVKVLSFKAGYSSTDIIQRICSLRDVSEND
ncbi:MAG: bifunctional D-glycero-beta-D-manno-heptose-7-phosphate kinase/D-glycero-beta-D-manno-heptose 1-phosphate adenylyltransferase HldE [Gammaproteobacteria bacterium]|nr:bifunctional D-glycero-beta-D-manno-heptose-7-phosphate kinase/D-glycero-beta-D-manno-heptose 1-phosphate adenylyltransferase HldE [Gammaproteobacteria bacterium]